MPYAIRKNGPKDKPFCVYNTETGEAKGCSTSKAKAAAHVRALYAGANEKANEPSLTQKLDRIRGAFDMAIRPPASTVEYLDMSIVEVYETHLVARCWKTDTYWKIGYTESGDDVTIQDMDEWEEVEITYAPVAAETKEVAPEEPEAKEEPSARSVLEWLQRVLHKAPEGPTTVPEAEAKSVEPLPEPNTFFTKAEADGQHRWVSISSTAFLDGQQDIVSRKGVDKGIARAKQLGAGKLIFWHNPKLPLGTCDLQMREGACLIESGLWDSTPEGIAAAKAVEENPQDWGISIGFLGYEAQAEVVNETPVRAVWTDLGFVERSILPAERAATRFSLIRTKSSSVAESVDGGAEMRKDQEEALAKLLGVDLAQQVATKVDQTNAKAAEDGAVFKEAPSSGLEGVAQAAEALVKEASKQQGSEPVAPATKAASTSADEASKAETEAKAKAKAQEPEADTDRTEILKALAGLQETLAALRQEVQVLKEGEAPKAVRMGPAGGSPEAGTEKSQEDEVPKVVKDIASAIFKVA